MFLEAIAAEPAFGLERRASQNLGRALRRPVAAEAGNQRPSLTFPLTREGHMNMLSAFCRGVLVDYESAAELLRRQAALLRELPNVVPVRLPTGTKLVVVGDLHGQYLDLMHIFRRCGFPSETNWYLFNGDFVDRGDCGVEVTLTIFGWQQVYPSAVFLNRGNHEERSVHSMHGFQQECTAKYDKDVYEQFNEAFAQLPIASVVNEKIIVLHGGVDDDVDMAALATVPRSEYVVNASNSSGGKPGFVHPHMREKMELIKKRDKQMHPVNAALWNDPMKHDGEIHNKMRGTGRLFGPDVTQRFLERSNLGLIIRSHEQVSEGFEWPFESRRHLMTVFSASNYAGRATNKGAVALIAAAGMPPAPAEASTGATVAGTYDFGFGEMRVLNYDAEEVQALRTEQRNLYKLAGLFVAKRAELKAAYSAAGSSLSQAAWVSATQGVLGTGGELLHALLAALHGGVAIPATVNPLAILDRFHIASAKLEGLYHVHRLLYALLYKMEAGGAVSARDFALGCKVMAKHFPADAALCADPKELMACLGAPKGAKDVSLQSFGNAFRVNVRAAPQQMLALELLHHMDRDYLRGLVDATNAAAAAASRGDSLSDGGPAADEEVEFSDRRQSVPYNALWAGLDDKPKAPVAHGRDSSSSSDVNPFAMLVRGGSDEELPGDDALPKGLIKQGSDVNSLAEYFPSDE